MLSGIPVIVPSQGWQTCQFFTLWSNLIVSDFAPWGDSLWNLTYLMPLTFPNTCLSHGKPYIIKPNFILDSSFPCCAWLCCHIHAHHTIMLLFHSATIMQLPHVSLFWYAFHGTVSIVLVQTCIYKMRVYKEPRNWLAFPVWFSWSFTSKVNSINSLHLLVVHAVFEILWGIHCFRVFH